MSPASEARAAAYDPAAAEAALAARCEELLERAAAAGAEEAEVYGQRAATVSVRMEKGDMKLTQVDEGSSFGVRVFDARRLGFASTNQEAPAALERTAADALALARLNPPDEANALPAARGPAPALGLARPELLALPVERAVELALELLERVAARDPRLSLDQASLSLARASQAVAASTGARAAESDAALSFQVFGMAVDGDDVGGFHYCGEALRALSGLEAAMERVVGEFADTALGNLGAGAAESYRGPVLFAPAAFRDVFLAPLVGAAGAIAVQRGRSALKGRLGEEIAAPLLSLTDDPHDAALSGACGFDREGQPTAPFELVRAGVLQGWLYNGYAAAVDGVASTGHARGDARSVPSLGTHGSKVAPGAGGAREDLLRALGRGLYVQRFSGSVDPASGDFSGVAKSARWVEHGAVARPVRETLLSGNAFELLRRIVALSTATERIGGAALVPWALVDGVSVTAG